MIVIVLSLAGLLLWSVVGRLVSQSKLKIVQPADAGIVIDILVRERQSVEAGQEMRAQQTAPSAEVQNFGSFSGSWSRSALRAVSNSGSTDCTVAQNCGPWFISRRCDSSCATT